MAVMPLMALPLSHVFVPGERMTLRGSLGLGIGFIGVLILIGFDALADFGGGGVAVWAQIACLAATVCYVSGSILIKRAPKVHPIAFAASAMLLGAMMAVPVALAVEGVPTLPGLTPTVALVVLAAGPSVLALLLMLKILSTAGPPFLSLVNYQVPVWATVFGVIFLGERFEPRLALALVVILFGIAVAQGYIGNRKERMA
jgi:drug/metabolite transporter (DMT)-like permease